MVNSSGFILYVNNIFCVNVTYQLLVIANSNNLVISKSAVHCVVYEYSGLPIFAFLLCLCIYACLMYSMYIVGFVVYVTV